MSGTKSNRNLILAVVIVVLMVVAAVALYELAYVPRIQPVLVCGTTSASIFGAERVYIWTANANPPTSYTLVEENAPNGNNVWTSTHAYSPGTMLYFTNSSNQPKNPLMTTVAEPSSGSCYDVGLVSGIS